MSLLQGGSAPPPYQQTPMSGPSVGAPGTIGFGMPDPAAYGANPNPTYGYQPGGHNVPPPPVPPPAPYYGSASSSGSYPRQPVQPAYGTSYGPPAGQPSYGPPPNGQVFTAQSGVPYQVVYVDGKPRKKKLGGMKNAALGAAAGLAGGYLASRLFGGWGWGGGFGGLGRWGSWSSLSSFSWSD